MDRAVWDMMCDGVTEVMRAYTRPFATPLFFGQSLEGSGNFVNIGGQDYLATCDHVAKQRRLDYRFFGLDRTFSAHDEWQAKPFPIDLAFAPLLYDQFHEADHFAKTIPYDRFAKKHEPVQYELLFFRGYAGENSQTIGGFSEALATGYCSQETGSSNTDGYVEIFWEPNKTRFTRGTSEEAKARIRYDDPQGFSGSLVWNTRFVEVLSNGSAWRPEDAVITGMAHRWDEKKKSLLVYRVEHIRQFISEKL